MRYFLKKVQEKLLLNFKIEISLPVEYLGSSYGGWNTYVMALTPKSVVYSFGVGEDISWDTQIIKKGGIKVYAFDPTPKSIEWIHSQSLPKDLIFCRYGVANNDGNRHFSIPLKQHWVSYSMVRKGEGVEAPVKKLVTIMRELDHTHIDILKLDIEGAENEVIEDMIDSGISPHQLLVEFHPQFQSIKQIRATILRLRKIGYKIFALDGSNYSFIRA